LVFFDLFSTSAAARRPKLSRCLIVYTDFLCVLFFLGVLGGKNNLMRLP